jgi:hypothetical protein
MPAIIAIIAYLTNRDARVEAADALDDWYAEGGKRPTLGEISAEADRRGISLPASWGRIARRLGARL